MSDFLEPWPKEVLVPKESGFFRRTLAVTVSGFSALDRDTMILPRPEGPMGAMGALDHVPGAIKVDPTFKLVFLSAVGLMVLVLTAWVIAAFAQPADVVRSLSSGCETVLKVGFGAVVDLLEERRHRHPRIVVSDIRICLANYRQPHPGGVRSKESDELGRRAHRLASNRPGTGPARCSAIPGKAFRGCQNSLKEKVPFSVKSDRRGWDVGE